MTNTEVGVWGSYVAFLAEASGQLVGTIDLESAASLAVELAVPTLADCAVLVLPDIRGRLEWWRWSGRGRCVRGRIRRPSAETAPTLTTTMLGQIPAADVPQTEVVRLPRALADPLARFARVHAVSLPEATVQGTLLLAHRLPEKTGEDERRVITEFTARASRAVAAAHRFERQKAAAEELINPLRPPALPVVPGIRMAAVYRPADGPLDVGGDFYDLHLQADGSTLFMLGDVCGKGAEAAAMSGRFRHALAALRLVEDSPRQLLRLVNQALLGTGGSSKFATLVLGLAARRAGGSLLLRVSSGGHPPPLVLRRDGTVDVVAVPGMLVGIMPHAQFGENTVELDPQDTLVLYTDGITEARGGSGGDELFGSERLRAVLAGCVGLPVEQVAARIDDAVQQWTDGNSRDDIALLAIQSAPGQ